jgi:hypothetical protein
MLDPQCDTFESVLFIVSQNKASQIRTYAHIKVLYNVCHSFGRLAGILGRVGVFAIRYVACVRSVKNATRVICVK